MSICAVPFRDLDRLPQQVIGTPARPAAMPLDADRIEANCRDRVTAVQIPVAERARRATWRTRGGR